MKLKTDTDYTAEIDTLTAQVTDLTGKLTAANLTVANLTANLETAKASEDAAKAELKQAKAAVADFEARVAAAVAKNGARVEAVPVPEASSNGGATSPLTLVEQYEAVKNNPRALAQFFLEKGAALNALFAK